MDQWEPHVRTGVFVSAAAKSDSNTKYHEKIFSILRLPASRVWIEFRGVHRVAWIKHSEVPDNLSAS